MNKPNQTTEKASADSPKTSNAPLTKVKSQQQLLPLIPIGKSKYQPTTTELGKR